MATITYSGQLSGVQETIALLTSDPAFCVAVTACSGGGGGIVANTLTSAANVLTSTVNAVGATAPIINSVANSYAGKTITTTINGIASGGAIRPDVANALTSAVNTLTSTVDGGVAQTAAIINTNALAYATGSVTSTINGVASAVALVSAGDVSGNLNTTVVDKIKGTPVSAVAPTLGQTLTFDGVNYTPATPATAAFTKVAVNTTATTAPGRVIAYFVDASGGPRTITLPLASTAANQTVRIKKVDSSINAITVARAGADLIDGSASFTISAQYDGFDFLSDSPNATWNLF